MDLKSYAKELYTKLIEDGSNAYNGIKESEYALYAVASLGLSDTSMEVGINNYLQRPFDFDKIFFEGGGMLTALSILGGLYAIKRLSDYREQKKCSDNTD